MRALAVLPFATADAPAWVREALEVRGLATLTGRCECGAVMEGAGFRAGEV